MKPEMYVVPLGKYEVRYNFSNCRKAFAGRFNKGESVLEKGKECPNCGSTNTHKCW